MSYSNMLVKTQFLIRYSINKSITAWEDPQYDKSINRIKICVDF